MHPRRNNELGLSHEVTFTEQFRDAAFSSATLYGLDAHLLQLLAGAWERLQRSGVLQARGIEEALGVNTRS